MYIQQLYTTCLAEAAYYIESEGEAVIIDPLREPEPYMELAQQRGATIKYVFETHFHADFVSGHIDLAKKTGASIVYGPSAKAGYDILVAEDEEEFKIGKIKIKVLHTPGHTLESSCFLLIDENETPYAVFTGDTLFVGDVGRPDLAVKSDLSREDLAGLLYDSLNKKIKTLPDEVIVYPAHGAGSACGKNIGKETFSTIGFQKKTNYALQAMNKTEFVKVVTDGLTAPPKYFFMDAMINKKGYKSLDQVMSENASPLSVEAFEKAIKNGALVLDARDADVFEKSHIPNVINIGLNGQYAVWVGTLLDAQKPLLLVTEEGKEKEAILRLARVGYENVTGFLEGGMKAWEKAGKPINTINSINPDEFAKKYDLEDLVIDVRNPSEWATGIIKGANLISLSNLEKDINQLDKKQNYYVHCAGGYRSMMAASILKKHGFHNITNIHGGINKIKETGFQLVEPEKLNA